MEPTPISHAAKRRRTTSGLTAQQILHKRDLDRKAQRALRDRTKTRIQDLEDDLARIKCSRSQGEKSMLEEIQALREQNRQLKSCLESIGHFVMDQLQATGSQPTRESPSEEVPAEQAESAIPAENHAQAPELSPGVAVEEPSSQVVDDRGIANDESLVRASEPHNSNHSGVDVAARDPSKSHAAISNTVAESSHPDGYMAPASTEPLGLIQGVYANHSSSFVQPTPQRRQAKAITLVEPKHTTATCPLDQILLDFIVSRRSMIVRGVPIPDVVGPERPSPAGILNPQSTSSTHPIIRVMTEVLGTFAHVKAPEKMAFMYLMHLTTRWQISPSEESYARMPIWLRPTAMQITIPHAAWIDNIPWPRVRDMLIEDPERYPFAVFSEFYSVHVSINWPYETEDAVTYVADQVTLNTIFERHIQRLSNWTVSRQFQDYFPEMTSAIYADK